MPKVKKSVIKKSCISIGTVSTPKGLEYLTKPEVGVDIIEVRVDCLRSAGMGIADISTALSKRKNPVLLTLRTMVEGGRYGWKSTERILAFQQLMGQCDAVDLEIRNMQFVKPVLQEARESGKFIILSAHSVNRKLTLGKAERMVEEFRSFRVDVYKLASLARTQDDLKVLVQLLIKFPQLRLGLMALGPMSQPSRAVLTALGSKLVYGYLDEPASDEQPSVAEIQKVLALSGLA